MAMTAVLPGAVSRLHVLEITGNAIAGGMEASVERLVQGFPPERVGVTALCPFESPFTERLRALGADVVIGSVTDDPSWQAIQLACSLATANAVDVIHTHLPNAHVMGGIVGRLVDKPVLATIHGRQLTLADLEVHRTASTHLLTVTRQSYLHALGVGVHPKRLHRVPNGVDTQVFAPGLPRLGAVRKRFGLDVGTLLVGFVGRLAWEKGPDVFVRAALAIHAARPDVHFVLVGEGPMQPQLEIFVERFQLADRVHFAGLQMPMPRVFAELDVVVSSSRSEAMPLAVIEAMASGLPVVACRVGAMAELLLQGVTGWLVEAGDGDGIASHVLELVRDAALRQAAGDAARERAEDRFALATQVALTHELLARLAGRDDARAEMNRQGADPVESPAPRSRTGNRAR
ncbi:MAG: glycosyltransferase [Caldimonas sp.]